ncbi:hypothetical protein DXG01_016541 [Tephrocybe rancida]|nr:hypothetical protein DXG01_016541 [Tephrocybe rancida]
MYTESFKKPACGFLKKPKHDFYSPPESGLLPVPAPPPAPFSIKDGVQQFFSLKAQALARDARGATTSRSTRRPQTFDKHLRKELRLKRVVSLPAIPSDLAQLAKKPGLDKLSNAVRAEKGVEDAYGKKVAPYCSIVAATLAYQLARWSSSCIEWATTEIGPQKFKGVSKDQAVADGFLNIVKSDALGKSHNLTQTQQAVCGKIKVLVIWEFKNLNPSEKDTEMKEIASGFSDIEFPSQSCTDQLQCRLEHIAQSPSGCRMGWDTADHPCPSYEAVRNNISPLKDEASSANIHKSARHIIQQVVNHASSNG